MSPVCICRCVSIAVRLPHKTYKCIRGISEKTSVHFFCEEEPAFISIVLFSPPTPQINGIALDNKSVTECEALLRSCRDSLSLSLMKVGQYSSPSESLKAFSYFGVLYIAGLQPCSFLRTEKPLSFTV